MEYRSKKALYGQVRILEVVGYDCCACCGTHVQFAGEIGIIKILSTQNYKGGTRLEIVCGKRAFADYAEKTENVAAISTILSVPTSKIAEATTAVYQERDALKKIISRMKWEKMHGLAKDITETQKQLCFFVADFDAKDMVHFADLLLEKTGGTVAVFSGNNTGFSFVCMSRVEDMRNIATQMKEAFQSKGSGKPESVQDKTEASRKELEVFFTERNFEIFAFSSPQICFFL